VRHYFSTVTDLRAQTIENTKAYQIKLKSHLNEYQIKLVDLLASEVSKFNVSEYELFEQKCKFLI